MNPGNGHTSLVLTRKLTLSDKQRRKKLIAEAEQKADEVAEAARDEVRAAANMDGLLSLLADIEGTGSI